MGARVVSFDHVVIVESKQLGVESCNLERTVRDTSNKDTVSSDEMKTKARWYRKCSNKVDGLDMRDD